ncbi:MAG TPA: ATP-binding cassette domain-containing protein [Baekduia sp.]|uniref:branched-chain amino acid ABC transporter ATP-binding protein/permease n=1 Tax=Baekduia sp. TaxID=2600305 RepID=UPI002CCB3F28|nr:ATP-binding cassette domain-containing protein [Baekduia sp.]HMJ37852.1 ATP-binding cassette domain-containing protein [Baekduia sp.]
MPTSSDPTRPQDGPELVDVARGPIALDGHDHRLPGAAAAREIGHRLGQARAAGRAQVDRLPDWLTRAAGNPLIHASLVLVVLVLWTLTASSNSYNLYLAQLACIYAIAALGLNIPGGLGGALSLGHGASYALGVYSTAILASHHGWPVWATLPVALAVGFAAGLLMGAPAGRLGAIALAMVSLGAVLVVGDMILQFDKLTGGTSGIVNIVMRFSWGDGVASASALAIVIFAVGWATYLLHWWYRSSARGLAAIASRDETIGAAASGISTYRVRMETFAIGSAIGALAGALFGYLSFVITPASVSPALSILFLVMVVFGGAGSRLGPVVGALVLTLVPSWLASLPHVNTFVYGGLLVLMMLVLPRGIMGGGRPSRPRPFGELGTPRPNSALPDLDAGGGPTAGADPVLVLKGVSRSFGEVKALEGVDFQIRPGEVVGLVGPNGSGKTTLLNVASGMYPASGGSVRLGGHDITRTAPHRIAGQGLARTFQTPKTFPTLSIGEHLAIASSEVAQSSDERRQEAVDTAAALLRMGGLDIDQPATLERPVGTLAQGQLRFLEVAMSVLHVPRVLLLDEPAAGLSAGEMEALERAAKALAQQGTAVVIVEHHLDLIRRLVDRVVVLHLGTLLWEGPPEDLDQAEAVRVAYLGIQQ